MRILLAILISLSTSLYGLSGILASHMEEQCHVVEGEHHEEALADHESDHHAHSEGESQESEKDCQPEHCSDHCNFCHASIPAMLGNTADSQSKNAPLLKEVSLGDSEKLSSISLRPDTPPPKV